MERFAPALRRIAEELDLPRGVRGPLLLEMAADLEAVFEHHRSCGLGEAAAARKAEEAVLGSSEVVGRLVQLHKSPWRDWSVEVGARLTGGPGPLLLAAGVMPVLVLAGAMSAWVLMGERTLLVWPMLVVGVSVIAVATVQAARLLGGRPLGRGSPATLLVLSALGPALGVLAVTLGLHAVAGEASVAADQVAIARRIAGDGAALLMGLLIGIAGLFTWFFLLNLETRRADREVEALLSGGAWQQSAMAPRRDSRAVLPLVRRRQG